MGLIDVYLYLYILLFVLCCVYIYMIWFIYEIINCCVLVIILMQLVDLDESLLLWMNCL